MNIFCRRCGRTIAVIEEKGGGIEVLIRYRQREVRFRPPGCTRCTCGARNDIDGDGRLIVDLRR